MVLLLPMSAKAYEIGGNCEKQTCESSADKCKSICTLNIKNFTESLTQLEVAVNLSTGVEVSEVNASDGWIYTGSTSDLGSTPTLTFTPTGTVSSNFTLATFTIEYDHNVDCTVTITGTKGEKVTIAQETTKQVKTGASLPIAIIAAGAGIAVVVYLIASKNKKLYKI